MLISCLIQGQRGFTGIYSPTEQPLGSFALIVFYQSRKVKLHLLHWIKNHPVIFCHFGTSSTLRIMLGVSQTTTPVTPVNTITTEEPAPGGVQPHFECENFLPWPQMLMWSYLAVQRIRKRTTWSCTELWRTLIPWGAGAGWASSAGTPGYQWGAQCRRCTPTVTGQRVPGRQTCPPCVRLCAAERLRNSPCSAWWSPRRSLARAWWSGQRVPRRLAGRSTERSWECYCWLWYAN